jgi:hypothetical protein
MFGPSEHSERRGDPFRHGRRELFSSLLIAHQELDAETRPGMTQTPAMLRDPALLNPPY